MADLVTVSEYKAYAGINSTNRDAEINALRGQISLLIKTYCGRTFIDHYSTPKTEYFDVVKGQSTVYPSELPIVEVVQLLERNSISTDKNTIENNLADGNNYHLLESGTPQCTLTSNTTESTCINNSTFTGTGLNDLTITGYNANTSSGEVGRNYKVQIDGENNVPDTFRWSRDGGNNWKEEGKAITGSSQTLEGDIAVKFTAITGHGEGDSWSFSAERWTGYCSNSVYVTQETCEQASEFWMAKSQYETDAQSQALVKVSATFASGLKSLKLVYKGGFASTPLDLKLACYDMITYYLKKESTPMKAIPGTASISHVTSGQGIPSDLPSHIKRILELYRNID